jgi:NADH dehydrogenase [ubiquinone] 1 alpha subcomplex assembly factor 7
MEDILRAARLRPEFIDAAAICLVETSGRLRHEQQKRLKRDLPALRWADAYAEAPAGPSLIVANEFFDCLPVRQFIRIETGWRERLVDVDPATDRLAFALADTPPTPLTPLPPAADAGVGDIFELNERAETQVDEIARALVAHPGRAIIIDYGHVQSGFGDTLQAVRRHAYWPALSAPGRADITAHVNFERLSKAAFAAGAAAFGPVSQGTFLERLGLGARAARLCVGKSPDEIAAIERGAYRLAAPSEMGELFKALCLSSPGLPAPAGFE